MKKLRRGQARALCASKNPPPEMPCSCVYMIFLAQSARVVHHLKDECDHGHAECLSHVRGESGALETTW